MQQLLAEGISLPDGSGGERDAEAPLNGRFAFVNVWRSIDPEHPVLQQPLAVCDERTVSEADKFKYMLRSMFK